MRTHLSAWQFARGVCGGVLTVFTPSLAKIASKTLVNLASRSRMTKRNGRDPVAEVHDQVAGPLGSPCAVRVGSHAQDVHVPGLYLHDEQHVQALEEDRVDVEEIAGQHAISLSAQERPPGGVHVPRGRCAPPGAQDPSHGRFADLVSEPAQFTVDPAVSPGRVLPRQPQCQSADLLAGARSACPVRVRPLARDQTMPLLVCRKTVYGDVAAVRSLESACIRGWACPIMSGWGRWPGG